MRSQRVEDLRSPVFPYVFDLRSALSFTPAMKGTSTWCGRLVAGENR